MRFILLLTSLFLLGLSAEKLSAQETKSGPFLKEFGAVYAVPEADLTLEGDRTYKVLFDIYTDMGGEAAINPLLNAVARFLNMHGQTGLELEQMDVVVVLHGAGVKNVLNDKAYQKKFNTDNPNAELLRALNQAGVQLYVCGQSLNSRGYDRDDLAEPVKLSLSAMTALVHFQEEGYRLINFN
jgi:intracellular sulfur oxidation DsrE/DsrF family protein